MTRRPNVRRLIAVIAAYAIALQAFVPLAVTLAAVPGGFPICASGSTDAPQAPAGHGHDALGTSCCALAGPQAVLPAPRADVLARRHDALSAQRAGHPAVVLPPSPRISPHAPRPPPAA